MIKILFIADFFSEHLSHGAGAESNDEVLIQHLRELGFDLSLVCSHEVTPEQIDSSDYVIVGNFVNLPGEMMAKLIDHGKYLIYEHDFKCFKSRDPSTYRGFKAPASEVVNRDFYKGAEKVVCLSRAQHDIIVGNLKLDNCVSIGTSLWTRERLELFRTLQNEAKNGMFAIVQSKNPIKRTSEALEYCKQNKYVPKLIASSDPVEFAELLAGQSNLVFLPGVFESFCRLVCEARMLNVSVITNSRMLGFASEDTFKMSGLDLINETEKRCFAALELFVNLVSK